jgi:hypothetical protein
MTIKGQEVSMFEYLGSLEKSVCFHLGLDANMFILLAIILLFLKIAIVFGIFSFIGKRKHQANQIKYFGRLLGKPSEYDVYDPENSWTLIREKLTVLIKEKIKLEEDLKQKNVEFEKLAKEKAPVPLSVDFRMTTLTIEILETKTEIRKIKKSYDEALLTALRAGFIPEVPEIHG